MPPGATNQTLDVLAKHGVSWTVIPFGKLHYYRSVPTELPNAAQASVLFEDELLVVADKPHFLPVVPSGNYLQQTLLVRLRRQLGLDALTPLKNAGRPSARTMRNVADGA